MYQRVHNYSPEAHLRIRTSPRSSGERKSFAKSLKVLRNQRKDKPAALDVSRRGKKVHQAFRAGNTVLKNLAMKNNVIRKYVEGSHG